MSDTARWHVLYRPISSHGTEVVAVYRTEPEASRAREGTDLGYLEQDERPEVGERWFLLDEGSEFQGALSWRYVPARCIDDQLAVGDSVKIRFLGDRDNPREITAYPAGRIAGSDAGERYVVVERDSRHDSPVPYGRIVSEHGTSLEDALLASLNRGHDLEIRQVKGPDHRPGRLADIEAGDGMRAAREKYLRENVESERGLSPER